MIYLIIGVSAYLAAGLVLTYMILPGPMKRALRFRDVIVGPIAMPVLFVLLIVFDISEEAWARILIMLDFDPPEVMRARPKPTSHDSNDPV
ncbi:MAG: hypothetical protein ACYCZX_11755 [Rhodospirillaceae bacterium]